MAPQYPYGGNVGAGHVYIDAIRQAQLDADVAKKVQARLNAEAAKKIIERGGSTPTRVSFIPRSAPNVPTRMAAQSPGFFQRLSGFGKYLGNPLVQGSIDVGGRLLAGQPVDEIIPQAGGGMAGSLLGLKIGSRFGPPGALIGSGAGYFLGSYLGGALDGSIEPQTPMSRTGVSGLTDYLNNTPDRKIEPIGIEEKPTKYDTEKITDAELEALNKTIQPIVPESVNPLAPRAPRVESGSPAALPGRDPVLSTPNNMQSELLKEATTMRRAKEMKELGITGGDEAMNKGSAMHKWLSIHGDMADNLIRDKRMREVRIAREFDRDFPTDARGLDGQMGNFEALSANREKFA